MVNNYEVSYNLFTNSDIFNLAKETEYEFYDVYDFFSENNIDKCEQKSIDYPDKIVVHLVKLFKTEKDFYLKIRFSILISKTYVDDVEICFNYDLEEEKRIRCTGKYYDDYSFRIDNIQGKYFPEINVFILTAQTIFSSYEDFIDNSVNW